MNTIDNQLVLDDIKDLDFNIVPIKRSLLSIFIKELQTIPENLIPDQLPFIVLDFEMYPNAILCTPETENFLRYYFDSSFFMYKPNNEKVSKINYRAYLAFKTKNIQKEINVDSVVRLSLDGNLYKVTNIDHARNKANLVNLKADINNINLKVNLEDLSIAEDV
jgi:hypothetical protein